MKFFGFGEKNDDADANLERMGQLYEAAKSEMAKAIEAIQIENEKAQALFLEALIKAKQELSNKPDDLSGDPINDQSTVIEDGGSGSLFSIRYYNGTAMTPPDDTHQLEWIAKSSAYDPALLAAAGWAEDDMPSKTYAQQFSVMWATGWTPVVGGDAVEYEEP